MAGLLLTAFFAFRFAMDFGTPQQGLALFAGLALSTPVNVLAHELGHALLAWILGCRVLVVEIGKGPRLFSLRFAKLRLDWRRYPFLGGETVYLPVEGLSGWRKALIAFGGPLANLLLAALFIILPALHDEAGASGWTAAAFGLALSNLGVALMNLWVWRIAPDQFGLPQRPSDGALILSAFRRSSALDDDARDQLAADRHGLLAEFDQAAALYGTLLEREPCDAWRLCKVIHFVDRAHGPEAALAAYRRFAVSGPPRESFWHVGLMHAFLHANLAWLSLKTRDPSQLEDAARYASSAHANLPEVPEVQATLGALHVREGRPEAAEGPLLFGLRGSSDVLDRADFCAFLAEVHRARTDAAMAAEFEALGRHLLAAA